VADPAVSATPMAVSAVEGTAFTNQVVATFTDPGGPELTPSVGAHYTASIERRSAGPVDRQLGNGFVLRQPG
jgi:hypothetical protein